MTQKPRVDEIIPASESQVMWRDIDYTEKRVSITIPSDWKNISEDKYWLTFKDPTERFEMGVYFFGDEEIESGKTGKEYMKNTFAEIALAAMKPDEISRRDDAYIQEEVVFGGNKFYKWHHPGIRQNIYIMRLKDDIGFLEFNFSNNIEDEKGEIMRNMLKKVKIY